MSCISTHARYGSSIAHVQLISSRTKTEGLELAAPAVQAPVLKRAYPGRVLEVRYWMHILCFVVQTSYA